MPKNPYYLFDLLVLNLRYAADGVHAGGLAHGLAVAAVALLDANEIAFALWLAALAAAFFILALRALQEAWSETKRELEEQRSTPARQRRTKRPSRTKAPTSRKNHKAERKRRR